MRDGWEIALAHYRRLLQDIPWLTTAMCWTVIVPNPDPLPLEDVARRVSDSADILLEEPLGVQEVPYGPELLVFVGEAGDARTMFENGGFLGSDFSVLSRLSARARVHSAYWDMDGNNRLTYAADGRVRATLDAMEPEESPGEGHRRLWPELEIVEEAAAAGDDWQAAALAAVELATGARLGRDWLEERHPCFRVRWPLAGDPARVAPATAGHTSSSNEVLASSGPEADFGVLSRLAGVIAEEFGFAGMPVAQEALARLTMGRKADERLTERLRMELVSPVAADFHRQEECGEMEEDPLWRRMQAALAFAIAAEGPGARPLGFDTFHHAELAFGERWFEVRQALVPPA